MSERTVFGRSDNELSTLALPFAANSFAGQVVMVSGAGSGIGRACSHWFARLGAKLVLCGRDAQKLDSLAQFLARKGFETLTHPLSIRDPDAVRVLHDVAYERFGKVDVVINNAGGQFAQAAIDFSPNGWRAVIDTNLNGTWFMMQTAARKWSAAKRGGVIVNVVTVIGRGMPGLAHTCAARAGVIYASKTVAVEWAPLGIRVNCIAPGIIASEGMGVYAEEVRRDFTNTNVMKRFGEVEDVANGVVFLAGETARFMTGEVLTIDGGNHLWGDQWGIPKPDYFKVP